MDVQLPMYSERVVYLEDCTVISIITFTTQYLWINTWFQQTIVMVMVYPLLCAMLYCVYNKFLFPLRAGYYTVLPPHIIYRALTGDVAGKGWITSLSSPTLH